jgi:hypothetical protein
MLTKSGSSHIVMAGVALLTMVNSESDVDR